MLGRSPWWSGQPEECGGTIELEEPSARHRIICRGTNGIAKGAIANSAKTCVGHQCHVLEPLTGWNEVPHQGKQAISTIQAFAKFVEVQAPNGSRDDAVYSVGDDHVPTLMTQNGPVGIVDRSYTQGLVEGGSQPAALWPTPGA